VGRWLAIASALLAALSGGAAPADHPPPDRITWRVIPLDAGAGTQSDESPRGFTPVWSSTVLTGSFWPGRPDTLVMDWGDVADGTVIDRFEFAYVAADATPLDVDVVLYAAENGYHSVGRTPVEWVRLAGLPGADAGCSPCARVVTVDLAAPLVLSGPDLESAPIDPDNPGRAVPGCDGFGLTDFGYSLHFRNVTSGDTGPLLAWVDPSAVPPCPAPGIMDAYDRYVIDPNDPPPPGELLLPDSNARYEGTFWFGNDDFAQFYFVLYTRGEARPCPNTQPACLRADIAPPPGLPFGGGDCRVDLGDLSVLLAHFGQTSGATYGDGDIEPLDGGDGDVDLGDLSVLLTSFGVDCN